MRIRIGEAAQPRRSTMVVVVFRLRARPDADMNGATETGRRTALRILQRLTSAEKT
jgi:hypothetical protein